MLELFWGFRASGAINLELIQIPVISIVSRTWYGYREMARSMIINRALIPCRWMVVTPEGGSEALVLCVGAMR